MKAIFSVSAVIVSMLVLLTNAEARYYDPMEGAFISKDPIGFQGGINVYAYVLNNPVNLVDPFGLKPGDVFMSPEEAVTDAIVYITPRSNAEKSEYGGWIK